MVALKKQEFIFRTVFVYKILSVEKYYFSKNIWLKSGVWKWECSFRKAFKSFWFSKERQKQTNDFFMLIFIFISISILIIYLSVYWEINQDLYNLVFIMSWKAFWKSNLFSWMSLGKTKNRSLWFDLLI